MTAAITHPSPSSSWPSCWPTTPPEILPGIVGVSDPMRRVAKLVRRCAARDIPTLVRGETGTGKELVAQALHRLGPRHRERYVALNGATLSDELGAAALFGHVRGAFTGAEDRRGALRTAHRGTLFIDEVAALSPRMQAMLLRVIEEGRVRPLGSDLEEAVDVRIVSATCEPLEQRVSAGAFRADLFQRLAACVVALPPLRQRPGDLPLLVARLLEDAGLAGYHLDEGALALLAAEPLPGNVRELRNVLTQASLQIDGKRIDASAMRAVLGARRGAQRQGAMGPRLGSAAARALVSAHDGNVSAAARAAGLPRSTFRDRLRRDVR